MYVFGRSNLRGLWTSYLRFVSVILDYLDNSLRFERLVFLLLSLLFDKPVGGETLLLEVYVEYDKVPSGEHD